MASATSNTIETATRQIPGRHLLIYANPSAKSFDQAIVDTYASAVTARRQELVVRDLYAMGFDPVLKAEERPTTSGWTPSPDVAAELEHVRRADILVLVYPIWYGSPPAILKGYVDRVLGANYSFQDFHDQAGQPPIVGKPLLSFSTSGMPLTWLHEKNQVLSLREIFDVYLWRGFGMKQSEHVMIDAVVPGMSTAYAAEQLERVRQTAMRACAMLANA
ncbi:MAG: NAD(P)H-dependent oxidoreductase [Candidatus Sphingomonas colombiensis]|nr:NAD(P)H-dependent oxidoreductase [Sphingomonas sp.]WEK43221.1 MAG: NAD(P)H-dependent oxidoreductase [Sphingomonas sp.]